MEKSRDPEDIVERYGDMVYRIAMVQMQNQYDAEDIFQEVFLRLIKYLDTLESEEHVKAWLIRVTVNCCHSSQTSAWSRHHVSFEENRPDEAASEELCTEEEERVWEAVRRIPEKYRSVIHLFYYEELSVREIGKCLGRSEAAVKVQLSRARNMLKKMLGEEGEPR